MKNLLYSTVLIMFSISVHTGNAQSLPTDFNQQKVATVYYPTNMAFASDGRIFVTEKDGKIKIIKNGNVLSTPFLTLNVNTEFERGVQNIIFDPDFSTNQYVYVYYTSGSSPIHNRLSRFTANGDVAVPGSEVVLLDIEPASNALHNGGGMVFGPDGKLYVGVGDDRVSTNAQDMTVYKGKILRLNKDGSAPLDNPFNGSVIADKIWAIGFRNPHALTLDPGNGNIFATDVGEQTWEEINNITTGGKNFGWPSAEGNSADPNLTNPVYAYSHSSAGNPCAITGITLLNAATNYPAQYSGKIFFIDYCADWIKYMNPDGSGVSTFATGLSSSSVSLRSGKDGDLYYFNISNNALYKITFTGGNNAPAILSHPVNKTVGVGDNATFSVVASGSSPLSYQWKKDGINISGANSASYTIQNIQLTDAGKYSVMVSNSLGNATSNEAILTVTSANTAPVASINMPANNSTYKAGDVINFSGSATDAEDGTLPANVYDWRVDFHHATHKHPGPTVADNVTNGSFIIPTTGEASYDVWYRIILTVTDSKGKADTASINIYPELINLTMETDPPGLQVTLDGQPMPTPLTQKNVINLERMIGVVSPQADNGNTYKFSHWMHGGDELQTINIPSADVIYTAVFSEITGIGEEISDQELKVYSYANKQFGIISGFELNQQVYLDVYNSAGQLLLSNKYQNATDDHPIRLNLSKFKNGIYLIRINNGSEFHFIKVALIN